MTDDAEPAGLPDRVGGVVAVPQVGGELVQPRLPQRAVDHLEQRPRRALGQPRVAVGIDAGSGGDRVADQPSRRREQDVRADAVTPSGRRSERGGQALGEPALHPARRHRDDLGRERIVERRSKQLAERVGKSICTFGSVDVEHALTLSRNPDRAQRSVRSSERRSCQLLLCGGSGRGRRLTQ